MRDQDCKMETEGLRSRYDSDVFNSTGNQDMLMQIENPTRQA